MSRTKQPLLSLIHVLRESDTRVLSMRSPPPFWISLASVECIRVVLDNLSVHSPAALYQRFAPVEARRILSRLEFHFTPKHASWLNMVEIEIGVMVQQCLDRRIPDKDTLVSEIAAWERRRNREGARIRWMFTVERAREKLKRAYPAHSDKAASRKAKFAA